MKWLLGILLAGYLVHPACAQAVIVMENTGQSEEKIVLKDSASGDVLTVSLSPGENSVVFGREVGDVLLEEGTYRILCSEEGESCPLYVLTVQAGEEEVLLTCTDCAAGTKCERMIFPGKKEKTPLTGRMPAGFQMYICLFILSILGMTVSIRMKRKIS